LSVSHWSKTERGLELGLNLDPCGLIDSRSGFIPSKYLSVTLNK